MTGERPEGMYFTCLAPYGLVSLQLLIRRDMNRQFSKLYTAFLDNIDFDNLFCGALTFCKK